MSYVNRMKKSHLKVSDRQIKIETMSRGKKKKKAEITNWQA